MHRILSFPMARGLGESSEFVTKRLCFSFLFSVGFLCLLCGFLLGRFTAERSMEARTQKMRLELAGNGLRNTEYLQQLAVEELEKAPFNHEQTTDWRTSNIMEINMQHINEFFSNLSFIHEVSNHTSTLRPYVRATVRGSREPDRYVILSVREDNVVIALELIQVLNHIYSVYNWRPRRSLVFCVSLIRSDVCLQTLPVFMQHKIMAYITVNDHSIQANGHFVVSGSDIMRSVAIEAIETNPSWNSNDTNLTYDNYETFVPRLFTNIPHVIFSFNESNSVQRQMQHDQNSRLYNITLAQVITKTIWRLSESIIVKWETKYFNETINRVLESIDTKKYQSMKEKLRKTLKILLNATKDFNKEIEPIENAQMLHVRILNDLFLDLDRALLCPDESLHSKTDLVTFRKLILESTSKTIAYLSDMIKCYEDAIQVLQRK